MHRLNEVLTSYAINRLHKGFIGSSGWLTVYSPVTIRGEAVAKHRSLLLPEK